jgi:hypothetical protein
VRLKGREVNIIIRKGKEGKKNGTEQNRRERKARAHFRKRARIEPQRKTLLISPKKNPARSTLRPKMS